MKRVLILDDNPILVSILTVSLSIDCATDVRHAAKTKYGNRNLIYGPIALKIELR